SSTFQGKGYLKFTSPLGTTISIPVTRRQLSSPRPVTGIEIVVPRGDVNLRYPFPWKVEGTPLIVMSCHEPEDVAGVSSPAPFSADTIVGDDATPLAPTRASHRLTALVPPSPGGTVGTGCMVTAFGTVLKVSVPA